MKFGYSGIFIALTIQKKKKKYYLNIPRYSLCGTLWASSLRLPKKVSLAGW